MNNGFVALLQKAKDKDILSELNKDITESAPQEYSSSASIWQLFGLIIILLLVLFAAYFTSKLVSKLKLGQLTNSNFKVIDTFQVASNKSLMIVKVGKKYILISITKEQVQYLTDLDEDEINLKVNDTEERNTFKEILDNIKNKKSKG